MSTPLPSPDQPFKLPKDLPTGLVIEYKYDPAHFEAIEYDKNYINQGDLKFQQDRQVWRAEFSVEDDEDEYDYDDELLQDVDHIITQMRLYKPFSEPVPLQYMAEILECVWTEAPTL